MTDELTHEDLGLAWLTLQHRAQYNGLTLDTQRSLLRAAKFLRDFAEKPEAIAAWNTRAPSVAEALTLIELVYYMEAKSAEWRAAKMNAIAYSAQNGESLAPYRRLFPRAIAEKSEAIAAWNTREPSVAEAARVLMQSKVARDAAFDAMWRVSEKHSLEATNRAGARYSITGDVVNEIWYAALRALAEKDEQP